MASMQELPSKSRREQNSRCVALTLQEVRHAPGLGSLAHGLRRFPHSIFLCIEIEYAVH